MSNVIGYALIQEVLQAPDFLGAFYASPPATALIRLCFAKSDATLDQGVERLARARKLMA